MVIWAYFKDTDDRLNKLKRWLKNDHQLITEPNRVGESASAVVDCAGIADELPSSGVRNPGATISIAPQEVATA